VNDFATAVEAGGFKNDIPGVNPSGNLLSNDTDIDDAASELVVTSIRTGNIEGSGTAGTFGSGSTLGTGLAGLYGSLQVAANGSWLYTLDNTNATLNALATGETLTEYFNYTVNDRTNGVGKLSDIAALEITIEGRDDEIRINSVFVNEGSPFAVFMRVQQAYLST
jgi:VCBS repeat-containing protein